MIKNIIIIILLLAFMAVIIFLDVPKFQKILDLRREVETQRERLTEKQIILAKVEKLRGKYEENEESLNKANYILPSGEDIPNLIVQFEALVLEGGMVLETLQFSRAEGLVQGKVAKARITQETIQKDYKILTVALDLTGSYSAFKNFLKLIENNIRLMDINSVNLSAESIEETEMPIFNFNVKLNTYYQ